MSLNLEETVVFAFSGSLPIRPIQKKAEILRLLEIVEKQAPKTVLEIGTQNGGTLYLLCQVAHPDATIISVDLPGGPFGGGYPEWRGQLYESFFPKDNQALHLLRLDSHDPETVKKVQDVLNGQSLDLLFIDADHTYEGVKRDYEMYTPLVRSGGMIVLHDIIYHPEGYKDENHPEVVVDKFWNEVKENHQIVEIIEEPKKWGGLGIITKR